MKDAAINAYFAQIDLHATKGATIPAWLGYAGFSLGVSLAVKQVDIEDKEAEKVINDFEADLIVLSQQFNDGEITQDEYESSFEEMIAAAMLLLFLMGGSLSADAIDGLTPAQRKRLDAEIAEQHSYTSGIASDIAGGRYQDEGEDATRREMLDRRVGLWLSGVLAAYVVGKMYADNDDELLQWRLGATKEHCTHCAGFHRQIKTRAEWREIAEKQGLYPQSRNLECKGYRCLCNLFELTS